MLISDKTLFISKLETLNYYIEKDIRDLTKDISYLEEQIKKYGSNEIAKSHTYGEVLDMTKRQLGSKINEIEENNRLIEMLCKTYEVEEI